MFIYFYARADTELILLVHCGLEQLLGFLEHGGALRAVPAALGLGLQAHAPEVEPLYRAVLVIAANHLAIGHLEGG